MATRRCSYRRPSNTLLWLLLALVLAAPAAGARSDDAYLEGYATAVVERELDAERASVRVQDGHLQLFVEGAEDAALERVVAYLSSLEGVVDVRVVELEPGESPPAAAGASEEAGLRLFPGRELFRPLLADPRWPHFSISHVWYLGDSELGRVGGVNAGETFALLRGDAPLAGRWEIGVQGGVFSIFDLEAPSLDLVNSDFSVGLLGSFRRKGFSALLRLYHQSSHLGDEYLLRNRVQRINLSYEVVDALLSHEFWKAVRLYGGGGLLVHRDPPDLKRGLLQAGVELTSPWAAWNALRPLAGLDLQFRQESDWRTDLSLRGGVQIESPSLERLRVQVLLEYFNGRSPNGQFFERNVEYVGLGAHFHF
jgi:hypothetical protein